MPKLIATRGIPASGKSTRAIDWVSADPRTRARVNRDLLRTMLHNGVFLQPLEGAFGTESAIVGVRDSATTALLQLGKDVVCDDTNLPQAVVRNLLKLAAAAGAEFEVWDLTDVPLEECLYRNSLRDGSARVPSERIVDMHTRFVAGKGYPLPMPELDKSAPALKSYIPVLGVPNAVIVDVDGTVALHNGRSPYDESRVSEDLPNLPVIWAIRAMAAKNQIIFCSGRTTACYTETADWLNRHVDVPFVDLLMRAAGDTRKDSVVKLELFDDFIRHNFNVVAVFDDRKQVVEMWRSLGLTVFQVAEGNF